MFREAKVKLAWSTWVGPRRHSAQLPLKPEITSKTKLDGKAEFVRCNYPGFVDGRRITLDS
jgi:hypothetical protein